MRRTATVRTGFQELEIWKSATAAEFRVAGATHAWFHRSRYLTGLAWDLIAAGALLGKEPPRSVLMLGLAGGTAFRSLRHLLPACRLAAVEIDEEIIGLSREHMDLDALGIEIHVGDAYAWLEGNERKFDAVIDDVYLAGKTDVFRPRSWDGKLLEHLCGAVAPGGVLAVNLVTGPGHRRMQSLTRRILLDRFPLVRSLITPEGMNEVLVAGEEVASRSRLDEFDSRWSHWRDRDFWERIAVRKLSPASR